MLARSGDGVLWAHGVGSAEDLPIPAGLAIAAAAVTLAVSFAVLALAWRTPRHEGREAGRPVPEWLARAVDSRATTVVLRAAGLAALGYVGWVATAGPDLLVNPLFGIVYVLVWVGLVPASLLLGPVWRRMSPVRTLVAGLTRLLGTAPGEGLLRRPRRPGLWPAALGLLGFAWLELVDPASQQLGHLRIWIAAYVVVLLVGGVLYGTRWLAGADPFEVYSTLVARLSVWGRSRPADGSRGTLVVRSPLATLAGTPPQPGLLAVVAVLLGSTAFDTVRSSPAWLRFNQTAGVPPVLLDTVMLVVCCLTVGVLLVAGSTPVGVRGRRSRAALSLRFAHVVVPVAVGYVVAHYLSYVVEVGQQTVVYLSDPMGTGADLFGTADLAVNYWLSYHPTVLATLQVLGLLLGHVVAVVAAHDRAVALLPRRHRISGQLPLLGVMVLFTVAGLALLLGP